MPDNVLPNIRIKQKSDTSTNWASENPALKKGELVIETGVSYIDKNETKTDGTNIHIAKDNNAHVVGNDETAVFMDKKQFTAVLNKKIDDATYECTMSEYDSLPGSKRTDDKVYFITDATETEIVPIIYGFHIDPEESDPSDAVTYIADATGFIPARMTNNGFSYGSWAGAFFMPIPCMVKYDGTVDYYLDPSDYNKKLDGTASDVASLNYDGNAMMEWPLIWYKYEAGTSNGEGYVYISNVQADDDFVCWSNYDCDNNIIPHFYTAIYNGTSAPTYSTSKTYNVGDRVTYSNAEYKCTTAVTTAESWNSSKWTQVASTTRLRSLSGVQLTPDNGNGNTTGTTEVNRAVANNTNNKTEWYIETLADRELINMLLVLIGKSLNCQAVFGRGMDAGNQSAKEAYVTGTLNDKGLFWGVTTNGNNAVKVFGMENYWACVRHRTAGMIGYSNGYKVKLTHGTADGSTAASFNSDGTGYREITVKRPSSGYLKYMDWHDDVYVPKTTGGTTTTYYSDYHTNGDTGYLSMGGTSAYDLKCGPFYFNLNSVFPASNWDLSAALSLKPLA